MPITTLDKYGLDFIAAQEGCVLHPYKDSKGIPTIAIGNTYYPGGRKVTMQDPSITVEQAYDIFTQVSKDFQQAVANTSTLLNQNQFNALFSLCYNIGINGYNKSTVHRLISANPFDENIAEAFLMWCHPPELLDRRKHEVALYFSPVKPEPEVELR